MSIEGDTAGSFDLPREFSYFALTGLYFSRTFAHAFTLDFLVNSQPIEGITILRGDSKRFF